MLLIRRLSMVVVWLIATAFVAMVVAQHVGTSTSNDVFDPIPPIELQDRPTVNLEEAMVAPVVSSSGLIVLVDDEWLLIAPVSPADVAYRLLDAPTAVKARVDGGPSGFDCKWVGLGPGQDGSLSAKCEIPADVRVAEGMTGTMVIQLESSSKVMSLPVTAVIGTVDTGQVVVVDDGRLYLRTVEIGVSDDMRIEIVSGLDPEETVLEFPTQRDVSEALTQ